MHKSELFDYLNKNASWLILKTAIQPEIDLYKRSLQEKGRSAYIRYDGDKEKVLITSDHLKTICDDYLKGHIDSYFISYIVDALLLSENSMFETDELMEKFELLTDFEINGNITKEFILEIYPSDG